MNTSFAVLNYLLDERFRFLKINKWKEEKERIRISSNIEIPTSTENTCNNLNTLILEHRSKERSKYLISMLLQQQKSNFFVPDRNNTIYHRTKKSLEEHGYCIYLVKDREGVNSLTSNINFSREKIIVFYDFEECEELVTDLFFCFFKNYKEQIDESEEKTTRYHITFFLEQIKEPLTLWKEMITNNEYMDLFYSLSTYRVHYTLLTDTIDTLQMLPEEARSVIRGNTDIILFSSPKNSLKQQEYLKYLSWDTCGIQNHKIREDADGNTHILQVTTKYKNNAPLPQKMIDDLKEEECFIWIRGIGIFRDKKIFHIETLAQKNIPKYSLLSTSKSSGLQ